MNGFKFIGYLNDPETRTNPAYINCQNSDHERNQVDNNETCDHTISCDICKIYWKYDSSD